jgi:hypothetical protein
LKVAFPIHPGLVSTDRAIESWGEERLKKFGGISPEESVESVLKVIDEATVEKDGGVFRNYDGSVIPW